MKLFATVLAVAVLALVAGPAAAQQCGTCAAPVRAQAVQVQQYHFAAPAAVAVPVAVVAVPSAPLVQLQVQPYYHAAPAAVQQVVVQRQVVQQVKVQAVQAHPQRVVQRSVIRSR